MKLLTLGLLLLASNAAAIDADPNLSSASSAAGCIAIFPDGRGSSLASAGLQITVVVRDANSNPIEGYPWQDIYVEDNIPIETEIWACTNGWSASGNTDANGVAVIDGVPRAGGSTQDGLRVALSGVQISGVLPINTSSPDVNASLNVDILDVISFSYPFLAETYDPGMDFNCDDILNLLDVAELASALGTGCVE